ncbi:palmitoyltransferase ZDHHC2-like [Haemaphysalis longicornis]
MRANIATHVYKNLCRTEAQSVYDARYFNAHVTSGQSKTTLASIPAIPERFSLSDADRLLLEERPSYEERQHVLHVHVARCGVVTRDVDGSARYCDDCERVKPDRCHHCSWCRRCIPKMDHHCPWLHNCVCFTTYKFFLLTVLYMFMLAFFIFVTTTAWVWEARSRLRIDASTAHTVILMLMSGFLSALLGAFLWVHVGLVCRNQTTLERLRPFAFVEAEDSFDLGTWKNLKQVLGSRVLLWPFPFFTSLGDGIRFPTRLHPNPDAVAVQEHERPTRPLPEEDLPLAMSSMETAFIDRLLAAEVCGANMKALAVTADYSVFV